MAHRLFFALLPLLLICPFLVQAQDAPVQPWQGNWAQSAAGHWVEYAMKDGPGLRLEVLAVKDGAITYRRTAKPAQGEPLAKEHTHKPEEIRPVMQPAPGVPVAWTRAEIEIAGSKLDCVVATWTVGAGAESAKGEVWYSAAVPCGGLVRQMTNGEATMWLTGFGLQSQPQPEPKPEPKPEPQPGPKAESKEYGDAVALEIPPAIRKQMEDQSVAITRMRVYFDDQAGGKDGASLQFEEMHTEVPVIFAAFLGERCDKVLNYADYSARNGRYVDLAFHIKTLPLKLDGMKVQVEHSHIQGEAETVVSTFDVPKPDEGDPWNDLRLRGARPGVNRYRLVVSYTNSAKEVTTYKGFSHWVLVQAPPMFEFSHSATATATSRQVGASRLISADVKFEAGFLLHSGLQAGDCTLRIVRRGKRDMNLDKLSPEVRRVLEKERAPMGWHEVGRGPLNGAAIAGLEKCTVEDAFVSLRFRHVLNASSVTLPLDENWEYRFELMHKGMAEPLATWTGSVKLKLEREADIASARLHVTGTALAQPLAVAFASK